MPAPSARMGGGESGVTRRALRKRHRETKHFLADRKERPLRFFCLTVAFAVCASAAALSANASTSLKTIRLVAVQQSQTQTKTGFVVRDNDFAGGRRLGHDTLSCVVISKVKANCKLVLVLAGGTLKGTVPILFTKTQGAGVITSGTGSYAGAKGALVYRNLNKQGTRTSLVVTLL